jgi:hypothetical protein
MQRKVQEKSTATLVIGIILIVAIATLVSSVVIDYLTLPGLLAIAAAVAVVISLERHHQAKVAHREQVLAETAYETVLSKAPSLACYKVPSRYAGYFVPAHLGTHAPN